MSYLLFYLYCDWDHCVQRGLIKAIAKAVYPSRVICIDRPGDPFVGLFRHRARLLSSLPGRNVRQVAENLLILRPLFLLNDYVASWIPGLNQVQRVWLRWLLHRMNLGPETDDRVISWLFSPVHWTFAGLYRSAFVVYHAFDESTLTSEGQVRPHHAKMDRELLQRADVVFTLSPTLANKKASQHANVHCIGQGVSVEMFSQALDDKTEIPTDLSQVPPPRVGLVGNIRDWLASDIIEALLKARPRLSIVFVGPLDRSGVSMMRKFEEYDNFYWLGPKPYSEVYRYLAGFDVGIIPYVQSEFTRYINPAKLYEYWAAGLPVVTTAIGGLREIPRCLWIATTAEEFVQAVSSALSVEKSEIGQEAARLAEAHSWEYVAERALSCLPKI